MKGTIRSIKADKNFGFIKDSDGKEYFFHKSDFNGHWNDLVDDIEGKQKVEVEFTPGNTEKGLRASNVSRLDWPNQHPQL